MQTSATKTKNNQDLKQQGFSLIEVLMAIFLIFVVVSIVPLTTGGDDRSELEDTLRKIERAIRFATNESILRNKIVRLRFILDEEPMTYTIEYGQSANFVLPQAKELDNLSLKDRETELKNLKKIDSQFVSIEEFERDQEPISGKVLIYALGTTYYPDLMKEGSISLYFYPTGEKDDAILFLYTLEELATLEVFPFEDRTKKDFILFSEFDLSDFDNNLEKKVKDIFDKWQKK